MEATLTCDAVPRGEEALHDGSITQAIFLDGMLFFGCSVYRKVASLAANQDGLPEPGAQSAAPSAAPAQTRADQEAGTELSSSQEQHDRHASASASLQADGGTDGIVLQSEGPQAAQQESKPLGRSLFQGAMRRLAGKQSEGAPDVQVRRAVRPALLALLSCMHRDTAQALSGAYAACCCRSYHLPVICQGCTTGCLRPSSTQDEHPPCALHVPLVARKML